MENNEKKELLKTNKSGQWQLETPLKASSESEEGLNKGIDILKVDENGQWSLDKAVKPGPTLDYSKINPKPNYAEIEANAPVIDYQNNRSVMPKRYAGAAERAKAVKDKIEAESKETALETINRRRGKSGT